MHCLKNGILLIQREIKLRIIKFHKIGFVFRYNFFIVDSFSTKEQGISLG